VAQPIEMLIVKDAGFRVGDTIVIEIDDVLQSDAITVYGSQATVSGVGSDNGPSVAYGEGVYGEGYYGYGADVIPHRTNAAFVAGDYSVRSQATDAAGNVGDWSDAIVIEHCPAPPPPTNLAINDGELTWLWSDP